MSATELKSKIIDKISTIENELILEEIINLGNLESDMDSIYRLADDERKAIELGL